MKVTMIEIKSYHYKNTDTWKILLTIAINLVSSKEAEEERALIM